MRIIDLGLCPYEEAHQAQLAASTLVAAGGPGTLFLLEHPPVITFGRNGGKEHLPFPPAFFEARGVQLVHSTRGGSITCHFPGQLVAYPVMNINRRQGGLRRFFYDMEETVIRMLASFGVTAARSEGRPGVWLEERKICSTGIAVKRWITGHGLAVNIARDLSLFDMVTPCGLPGVTATSLHRELNTDAPDMAQVKNTFAQYFRTVFAYPDAPLLALSGSDAQKTLSAEAAARPGTTLPDTHPQP